ncbi:MAG: hypothetical protein HRU41_19875 [Saprospiraceae bacterium]|nr:hypothetical protein [Saprospiraceae bacterium]
MSLEFSYDYKKEVLVFRFPDDQIRITYYLNKRQKAAAQHYQIWLKVSTAQGSYRMRSYAFEFFQRCFRRIKCDRAKWEAKEIIRHLRQEAEPSKGMVRLLAEYEQEQKAAIEDFEEEE